jgi:integrase
MTLETATATREAREAREARKGKKKDRTPAREAPRTRTRAGAGAGNGTRAGGAGVATATAAATATATVPHPPGGMGVAITPRRDGRYQAAVQRDGRRRYVYGRNPAEVAAKLERLLAEIEAGGGTVPRPGRRTVGELLDAVLEHKRGRVAPRTHADYAALCHRYLRPALGHVKLAKLTPARIQRCYDALLARGVVRQAAAAHAFLTMALRLARRWGWLGHLPTDRVEPPRRRRARRQVWTREELTRFLACPAVRASPYYPLWLVALASGCRPGELLALRWGDIDWERGVLRVRRAGQHVRGQWVETEGKTPAARRDVALPAVALDALRAQRQRVAEQRLRAGAAWQDHDLVFPALGPTGDGRPLQLATANRALGEACARAGVPRLSMHGFRHLHGSLLLDLGLPLAAVSLRLGHAHPGITASVYSHAVRADSAAALLDRALDASSGTLAMLNPLDAVDTV